MSILEEILATKVEEVARRRRETPPSRLEERARARGAPLDFAAALRWREAPAQSYRIIAEVKKASPSRGVIRADFDPVWIASRYVVGGAAALSVLTDERYFQGSLATLEAVRAVSPVPILRKDFVIDSYQALEARAAGADAILLIAAAFADVAPLRDLAAAARGLGLGVLWEVHDEVELERIAPLEPAVVGINNRDLRTFKVDLETSRRLLPRLPPGAVSVSESGFFRREELARMRGWGVDAFLIGESLMRAPDPGVALGALLAPEGGRE